MHFEQGSHKWTDTNEWEDAVLGRKVGVLYPTDSSSTILIHVSSESGPIYLSTDDKQVCTCLT